MNKKTIMLTELRKLLVILNDIDKKVFKDLKTEAFDTFRGMNIEQGQ